MVEKGLMLDRLLRCMETARLDAMLFYTKPYTISGFWQIFGYNAAEAGIVTKKGKMTILTWKNMIKPVEELSWADEVIGYYPWSIPGFEVDFKNVNEAVKETLTRLGIADRQIGIEQSSLTYGNLQKLEEFLPLAKLVDISKTMNKIMARKSGKEVEFLKELGSITDAAIKAAKDKVREGAWEYEVQLSLIEAVMARGCETTTGPPVGVVCGPRTGNLGYYPSYRRLRNGDFVLYDFGACSRGYFTDICRTTVVGEPDETQRRMLEAVLDAWQIAFQEIRPGVKARDVDKVAREHLAKSHSPGIFDTHLGHPMGSPWGPLLNPNSEDILEEGMTVALEPGVYVPGFGGVRIEDDVLVTSKGAERITNHEQAIWD